MRFPLQTVSVDFLVCELYNCPDGKFEKLLKFYITLAKINDEWGGGGGNMLESFLFER